MFSSGFNSKTLSARKCSTLLRYFLFFNFNSDSVRRWFAITIFWLLEMWRRSSCPSRSLFFAKNILLLPKCSSSFCKPSSSLKKCSLKLSVASFFLSSYCSTAFLPSLNWSKNISSFVNNSSDSSSFLSRPVRSL